MQKIFAMQVAAIVPNYVSEAEVPADVVEHEKKILTEQVVDSGKPANVAEKIVGGRMKKTSSKKFARLTNHM